MPDSPYLLVYHFMHDEDWARACSMCSMWVDDFDGVVHHITAHAAFAVIAPAPLPALRARARRRGWRLVRLLSAQGTTLATDFGLIDPHWDGLRPAISVLERTPDGTMRHRYTGEASLGDTRRTRHRPAQPRLAAP